MLNNEQTQAVNHELGSALVVAGPGSGKTTVITHHIKYLIYNLSISPSEILAISFSRAASNELKSRYKQLDTHNYYDISFGTFHSIFLKFLITYSIDIPQIIDEKKRSEIIQKIAENTDTFEKLTTFITYKKTYITPHNNYYDEKLLNLFNEYEYVLNELQIMDFDDILIKCYDMLKSNIYIREKIRKRYKCILIDEFQDINEYQYEAIKLISDNNIFAVGDEDQSIYSFRGSQSNIMFKFNEDYKNVVNYYLSTNYRCHKDIIKASQIVISHNQGRYNEYIPLGINDSEGKHFEVFKAKNYAEELNYIFKEMSLCGTNKSLAILVRTNNDVQNFKNKIVAYNNSSNEQIKSNINKILYSYLSYTLYKSEDDFLYILNIPNRSIPRNIINSITLNSGNKNKKIYFHNELEKLNNHFKTLQYSSPLTFILYVWNIIDIKKYIYDMFPDIDKESIIKVLTELLDKAKTLKALPDLYSYIKENNLIMELKESDILQNIKILTFHASKGLEFDSVIIPDVIEGIIPGRMSIGSLNIEEERRLFYVAMTRAKDYLGIITLQNPESAKYIPSRFLDGLI